MEGRVKYMNVIVSYQSNGKMCSKEYTFCQVFIIVADYQEGP